MHRSRHSLHPAVPLSAAQEAQILTSLLSRVQRQKERIARTKELTGLRPPQAPEFAPSSYSFPVSTISLNYNFDAYLNLGFVGADPKNATTVLVDSGNTSLIVPRWEDIATLPNHQDHYKVLGQAVEPWGCPANVVRGPMQLFDENGAVFTIEDCVFYACTADGATNPPRTANFGTGCVSPWSVAAANVPPGLGVALQSPFSQTDFPFVEFDYAPAQQLQLASSTGAVSLDSAVRLYNTAPDGYQMFDIRLNCEWMSLTPKNLSIGGHLTKWPGALSAPIAMIDTGGGPVYLSDPNGDLYPDKWPSPVANPSWTADSTLCESTQASVGVTLSDPNNVYSYTIDDSLFPSPAQGLTLVICENNSYMMGQQGLNIGGISALVNSILIDFKNKQVGFKKRNT